MTTKDRRCLNMPTNLKVCHRKVNSLLDVDDDLRGRLRTAAWPQHHESFAVRHHVVRIGDGRRPVSADLAEEQRGFANLYSWRSRKRDCHQAAAIVHVE